jgi:predicted DNA-binding transcriptional regulator YafY
MQVLPYASLDEVRRAIRERRILTFRYRKQQVTVEPHLLGNARKTHAFVMLAWSLEPLEGWDHYRFAEMRDLELLGRTFPKARRGFNPYDRKFAGIDTSVRDHYPRFGC